MPWGIGISRTAISGFFLVSDLSASSPVARRRAVVVKARRAMKEAILYVAAVGVGGFGVEGVVDDVGFEASAWSRMISSGLELPSLADLT